jgi:hypothetical protein
MLLRSSDTHRCGVAVRGVKKLIERQQQQSRDSKTCGHLAIAEALGLQETRLRCVCHSLEVERSDHLPLPGTAFVQAPPTVA